MGGDDDDTRLPPSNPNESSDGNWSIYSLEVPISGEPLCLLRVCNATMYMLLYIPYLRYLHTLLSKSSIFSIAEEFNMSQRQKYDNIYVSYCYHILYILK